MSDHQYVERLRECTARKVAPEQGADLVEWLGGPDFAVAMPDGSMLVRVRDAWLTAPVGHYIVREQVRQDGAMAERITIVDADEFETKWAERDA